MLAYLLILGMAYAVAYGISVSGASYGRAAAGFFSAVVVAWICGSIVVVYGAMLLTGKDEKQFALNFFLRAFGWAVLGAGIGVFRARRRKDASTLAMPKWGWSAVLTVILAGFMLAVVLPAYQDYANRSQKPWGSYQAQQSATAQAGASSERPSPSTATPANPYPGNLPGAQIRRPASASQADWENGDIVTQQAPTDSTPAVDAATNEHLHRIYAAHPDADAIFASADFRAWMARYPAYQRIASEGTTQEVIEMFTAYKNQRQLLLYGASAAQSPDNPKKTDNRDLQQSALSQNSKVACIFKPVMSDADYRACGISPPSK